MKRAFYPPLLAIFLVLTLFNANSHRLFSVSVVWLPILISLGTVGTLWTLGRLALKSWTKAALPTCTLTIMFLEYEHFRGAWDLLESITLTLWIAYLVLIAIALIAIKKPPTRVLNILAISLVLVALVPFCTFALSTLQPKVNPEATTSATTNAPDIYYIIPDEYGRSDVLLDMCSFDNSDFLDYLRDKGFYVSNDSYANYLCTTPSLLAALDMRYLAVDSDPYTTIELYRATWASAVPKYLKQEGYTLIQIGTSFRKVDIDINYTTASHPEFVQLFWKMSLLYPEGTRERDSYNRTLYRFNKLKEISQMPEPTFTFVHILACHSPYVFNVDGTYRGTMPPTNVKEQCLKTYVQQIQATNTLLRRAIDIILAEGNAIIVLQSDSSIMPSSYLRYKAEHKGVFSDVMQEDPYIVRNRLAILNAVYSDSNYKFTSPVNTFRVLLNHYFNTDYEILPDRYFWAVRGLGPPWDVFEVTDALEEYDEE